MKNLLFTLAIVTCFSFEGISQFSESFFERLGPTIPNQYQPNRHNFFGIKTPAGALAVRLADSLDTEVQWVKTDLGGNYETMSANLPTNSVSINERIIQLFEVGNKQYIVTNDSSSYAPRGIRIHKFENYTQNAGYFEFPTNFSWKSNQAYFQNGKIYIFFITASNQFKRLTVDPATMILENEIILSNYTFSSSGSFNSKSIHVHFINATDMDVYLNAGTKLARIKVTNNVASPVELQEMRLKRVLGIDPVNNKLICLKTHYAYDLHRYELLPNVALADLQIIDSLDLPNAFPTSIKEWAYVTDGTTELFHSTTSDRRFLIVSNNQVIAHDSTLVNIHVTNIDLINGKPITFGMRTLNYVQEDHMKSGCLLFISYGQTNQLYQFKEYYGVYSFGDFKTRFGTGNALITPIELYATGDFIFSSMIYNLSQIFTGKKNGQVKGFFKSPFTQQYKPGPYTQLNKYSQEIASQYNENLYVDLYMLNNHVASTGNPSYLPPPGILNWPAHGDVSKGQAANLAPFMDLNNNGTYDPLLGEYPVFPGSRCLLNISHQHESDFNNEGSGLELHTYMYKFDCGDSIENVIFIKTDVFNRGNTNFDSLTAGLTIDFDLGGPFDDYVGTHVENGLLYAYNGDDFDYGYDGTPGFGDSVPTIGLLFLQGSKFPTNGLDDSKGIGTNQTVNGMGFNDGIVDNEYKGLEYSFHYTGGGATSQSDGINTIEWNNYLNGKWKFGDSLLYGGFGFPGGFSTTHIPSRYTFADNTDPLFYGTYGIDPGFYWSESNHSATGLNSSPPGDRRMVGSFGSSPLAAGNKVTYHSAVFSGKRAVGLGQSEIDLFAKSKHVRNAFDNNLTSCGQTFGNTTQEWVTSVPETVKELEINVYPNPFADEIFIAVSLLDDNTTLQLFDINGKIILSEKVTSGKHVIKTSSVENGIYFLKIQNGNGTTTEKVVKQ